MLCWLCCVSSSDHRVHNHQQQQHWLCFKCAAVFPLSLSFPPSVPFVHSLSLRRLLLLLQHRSHPRWRLQKRVIISSRLRLMVVVVVVVHCTVLSVCVCQLQTSPIVVVVLLLLLLFSTILLSLSIANCN